jgi:PIN domain nuclease of toxin-antitoxin system
MSSEPTSVLDASALLAYLQDEPGADIVAEVLVQGAALSAVNWAEVLCKLARGQDPDVVAAQLTEQGLLSKALLIYPLDEALARYIAKLYPQTRSLGLTFGACACLALAMSKGLPVLTAERDWASLSLGCTVIGIRS